VDPIDRSVARRSRSIHGSVSYRKSARAAFPHPEDRPKIMGQVRASGESARARARTNGIEFPIIEIPNGRAGESGEREGKGGGGRR